MAPSTSGLGARSEPIASRAMTVGMRPLLRASVRTLSRALEFGSSSEMFLGEGKGTGKSVPSDQKSLSLLFHFQHFAAFVVAALGAGTMRQLALMAIGALGEGVRGQVIVGTTDGRAPLRVSPFRICHYRTSCLPQACGSNSMPLGPALLELVPNLF